MTRAKKPTPESSVTASGERSAPTGSKTVTASGNRFVAIGGDASGNVIITGDNNKL